MFLLSFVAILLSICFANAKYESANFDRTSWRLKTMSKHERVVNRSKGNVAFLMCPKFVRFRQFRLGANVVFFILHRSDAAF